MRRNLTSPPPRPPEFAYRVGLVDDHLDDELYRHWRDRYEAAGAPYGHAREAVTLLQHREFQDWRRETGCPTRWSEIPKADTVRGTLPDAGETFPTAAAVDAWRASVGRCPVAELPRY